MPALISDGAPGLGRDRVSMQSVNQRAPVKVVAQGVEEKRKNLSLI